MAKNLLLLCLLFILFDAFVSIYIMPDLTLIEDDELETESNRGKREVIRPLRIFENDLLLEQARKKRIALGQATYDPVKNITHVWTYDHGSYDLPGDQLATALKHLDSKNV